MRWCEQVEKGNNDKIVIRLVDEIIVSIEENWRWGRLQKKWMEIIREDRSDVDEDMVRGGGERYGSHLRGTKTKEKIKFKKNSYFVVYCQFKVTYEICGTWISTGRMI